MDLEKLNEKMSFKWRVQSLADYGATCVAYVDSRDVQRKLDEACGKENWQDQYQVINNNLYAGVAVWEESRGWVWKWDCGTESNTEREKGQASDAFKRAAVKWGVGRFLYDLPIQKTKVKKHTNGKNYPTNDDGDILWDGDALTDFLNARLAAKEPKPGRTPGRYEKPDKEPGYDNPDGPTWSKKVQGEAKKVEKNGLSGSEALIKYIPAYNEKKGTSFQNLKEFNTDKLLRGLIEFVKDIPPEGMV